MVLNNPIVASSPRKLTVEEVLDEIGTGKFHYVLCLVLGLAYAQSSIALMSLSLLLPAASADLSLDAEQQSLLSSCACLGMLIGAAISASLADNLGRKLALTTLLSLLVISGIMTAFAPGFEILLISRIIVGIGDGGFFPILLAYYVEFLPIKGRGPFMVALQFFWVVGTCLNAGFGWALIPHFGWRIFQVSTISPALFAITLIFIFVPESPRYFMIANKPDKAQAVLGYIEKKNRRKNKQTLDVYDIVLVQDEHEIETLDEKQSCGECVQSGFGRYFSLVSNRNIRCVTLLALSYSLILNGVTGILQPWLPTMFEHFGSQSLSIYAKNFIMMAGSVPGNVASWFLIDWLGRKKCVVFGFIAWAIGLLAFCLCPLTSLWPIVAACVQNSMNNFSWNVYSTWAPELFPTEVRSSALGFLQCLGIVMNAVTTYGAGMMFVIDFQIPVLVAIALSGLGALIILPLPETKGASLKDQLHIQSASDLQKLAATSSKPKQIVDRDIENVALLSADDQIEDSACTASFLAPQQAQDDL